jgi:hypothetical protein
MIYFRVQVQRKYRTKFMTTKQFYDLFSRSSSKKSFSEVEELKDDFDPDEGDDEPLQPDVVLVAQVGPHLRNELALQQEYWSML